MAESESCLPPFEFSSGYTFKCIDMADIGVKFALKSNREEDRAIILPPEECDRFLDWQQRRIGKRTSMRVETTIPENAVYEKAKRQVMIAEKITSDIETLYEIIENDIGVTADEIRNFKKKLRPVVFARDLICFVIRLRFKLSTLKIVAILGAKAPATAMLAFRKFNTSRINKQLYEQPDLLKIYEDAKRRYKRVIIFYREGVKDGDTKSTH